MAFPSPTAFSLRRDWLKAPRQLSLTRPGKFFLLITLAVGFGAINTGNNLLFLLFGMLLSLIIASGVLSEAVIRHARPHRRLPRRMEAGQPAPGAFRIRNPGSWPALSIQAAEINPRGLAGPLKGKTVGPEHIPWWKFWRGATDVSPAAAAYCLRAAADTDQNLPTHYNLPARGLYELPGLTLSTRFPFGLFEKSRSFPAAEEILVFPRVLPADLWLERVESRWGDVSTNRRGTGEEFFGLRQYRDGEDQRQIHWKSTARRGEPLIRQTEAQNQRALAVILDHRSPLPSPPASIQKTFEEGLSRVCGLLETLQRRGIQTTLITCDETLSLSEGLTRALGHLATMELLGPDAAPPSLAEELERNAGLIHIAFRGAPGQAPADALSLSFDELDR